MRRAGLSLSASLLGAALRAQAPSFVATPLTDMSAPQTYLGFPGGLYPNGSNVMPPDHAAKGAMRAAQIQPLDTHGNPSLDGRIVLLSIGMSNASQEFCITRHFPEDSVSAVKPCNSWTFVGQALSDGEVNHATLALVNGAWGGLDATFWDSPTDTAYDLVRDHDLAAAGLTEAQIQVIWLKEADKQPLTPTLPAASADAYTLETLLGQIVRAFFVRYPNLKCVFLSSRIYGGYAQTPENPEPYAYESGLAVKWLIQAQIDQMANGGTVVDPAAGDLNHNTIAPWIAWGPYLWADGTIPRIDGLTWELSDFGGDGTHPSTSGETNVGTLLLDFFKSDPRTQSWFLAEPSNEVPGSRMTPRPAQAPEPETRDLAPRP